MAPVCYIVGACPPGELVLRPGPRLVIAADRGLVHLEEQGLVPDLIVGDFDSLGRVPAGDNIIRHPVEKDDTDTMLAVKTGLERGCRTFVLYGGVGGRLDHTVANLQTLSFLADHGARGYLVGEGFIAAAIKNGSLDFGPEMAGTISVFCAGSPAGGVDLEGLYYPLHDGVLTAGFPLGVSNSFTGRPARVSVRRGTLLVLWEESARSLVERLTSGPGVDIAQ